MFESAGPGQVSSWYDEKAHSLFTYYFLRGLSGESDSDGDNAITVDELAAFIGSNVSYVARRLRNREQTPKVWGDKSRIIVRY